jgi:hydroxyacylglutathione hydrolase
MLWMPLFLRGHLQGKNMLLKYFYDRELAQASYMVGDQDAGEALVIDPARHVEPYLQAARQEGLSITQVTETHIHADFVSGSRELAARTGARLYLSAMGGADWSYAFADQETVLLRDDDSWTLGSIRFEALHMPGHTPEHLVFQITDAGASAPMALFTGDCLFVGDVGRPDLLETAAGIRNTSEAGAREQFRNVQRLKAMPDYLQVLPGHGAGSACGKALGAMPSSTIGYEKLVSPAFQIDDEETFVRWLLEGQPETPPYFAQMKRVNRQGPALLKDLSQPQPLERFILPEVQKEGALVIDTRSAKTFAQAHVPGTLSIPPSSSFSTYAGWFVDYTMPTYLIASRDRIDDLVRQLRAIGVDNIPGYFPADLVEGTQPLPTVDAQETASRMRSGQALLLDVRSQNEYDSEHIEGARHIFYGKLAQRVAELLPESEIIIHCTSGTRSLIAASLLQSYGFSRVANMRGGIDAWRKAGLPVVEG